MSEGVVCAGVQVTGTDQLRRHESRSSADADRQLGVSFITGPLDSLQSGLRRQWRCFRKRWAHTPKGQIARDMLAGIISGLIVWGVIALVSTDPNLGPCASGMKVSDGKYCTIPTEPLPFTVRDGSAITPWPQNNYSASTDRDYVKVDAGDDSTFAFQARKEKDRWHILVVGPWHTVTPAECHEDTPPLQPGQQCLEERTKKPFRVYATDELTRLDRQADSGRETLFDDGYGVFYRFIKRENEEENISPSEGSCTIGDEVVWLNTQDARDTKFIAVRQTGPDGKAHFSDQWIIRKIADSDQCSSTE